MNIPVCIELSCLWLRSFVDVNAENTRSTNLYMGKDGSEKRMSFLGGGGVFQKIEEKQEK
jgi:hypothetical protein